MSDDFKAVLKEMFSKRAEEIRTEKGLSQEEMAELLHVTPRLQRPEAGALLLFPAAGHVPAFGGGQRLGHGFFAGFPQSGRGDRTAELIPSAETPAGVRRRIAVPPIPAVFPRAGRTHAETGGGDTERIADEGGVGKTLRALRLCRMQRAAVQTADLCRGRFSGIENI